MEPEREAGDAKRHSSRVMLKYQKISQGNTYIGNSNLILRGLTVCFFTVHIYIPSTSTRIIHCHETHSFQSLHNLCKLQLLYCIERVFSEDTRIQDTFLLPSQNEVSWRKLKIFGLQSFSYKSRLSMKSLCSGLGLLYS